MGGVTTVCILVVLLVTIFIAMVIAAFANFYMSNTNSSSYSHDLAQMQEIMNHLHHIDNRQRSQFESLRRSIANLTARKEISANAPAPAPHLPDAHIPERPHWTKDLSHTESYQRQCYLPTKTKRFTMSPANYVINDKSGFVYFEIPKVASTALRLLVSRNFQKSSHLLRGAWHLTSEQFAYFKFTCVRDPLDRFVSTFNFLTVMDRTLKQDRNGGLGSPQVVNAAEAWALQIYLEGWWNWHLWPQSNYLANNDGSPRAIDFICDTSNLQQAFNELSEHTGAKRVSAKKLPPFGGRFTKKKVLLAKHLSSATVLLICEAYRADYCCFNLPLPPACERALHDSDGVTNHTARQILCEDFSSSLAARASVGRRGGSHKTFVSGLNIAALERRHQKHLTDMKLHEPHLYGDEWSALKKYKAKILET